MKTPPSYSIPVVMIASAVGWLSWAHLGPPAPMTDARIKVAPVEAAMLSPKLVARTPRDPFLLEGEVAEKLDAAEVAKRPPAKAVAAASKASGAKSAALAPANRLKATWAVFKAYWDGKGKELALHRKMEAQARATIASQARLSATSLGGARRFATINDRVFAEGEVIDAVGGLAGPIVLSQVRPGSVTLSYLGSPTVVNFASSAASRSPASPAAVPPQTAKARPGLPRAGGSLVRRYSGARP